MRQLGRHPRAGLFLTLSLLVVLNIMIWGVYNVARSALEEAMGEGLVSTARLLESALPREELEHLLAGSGDTANVAASLEGFAAAADIEEAFILSPERILLASSDPTRPMGRERWTLMTDAVEIREAMRGEEAPAVLFAAGGRYFMRAYVPVSTGRGIEGVLGISAPARYFRALSYLRTGLWAGTILSVVAALVFSLAYRRMLRAVAEARVEVERQTHLAAIGRMAATVAHEIRNPLNIISGTVEILEKNLELGDEDRDLLDYITGEVERLEKVASDLLDVSRIPRLDLGKIELNPLMERVAGDLERKEPVPPVSLDLEADLGMIRADPDRLYQAALNLVINAREAAGSKGEVIVRTRREGNWIAIEVEDNGPGIPEEMRKTIFEPFYSTREKGSGLGLAVVASVARAHGGQVEAKAGAGGGARFILRIPRSQEKGS